MCGVFSLDLLNRSLAIDATRSTMKMNTQTFSIANYKHVDTNNSSQVESEQQQHSSEVKLPTTVYPHN